MNLNLTIAQKSAAQVCHYKKTNVSIFSLLNDLLTNSNSNSMTNSGLATSKINIGCDTLKGMTGAPDTSVNLTTVILRYSYSVKLLGFH